MELGYGEKDLGRANWWERGRVLKQLLKVVGPLDFEPPSQKPLPGYAKSRFVERGLVTKVVHNILSVSLSLLDCFGLTFGGGGGGEYTVLRLPIIVNSFLSSGLYSPSSKIHKGTVKCKEQRL